MDSSYDAGSNKGKQEFPYVYPPTLKEYFDIISSNKDQTLVSIEAETSRYGKVVCDPVHGFIPLHPLVVKVIDTPQFQRLRYIKALGSSYFVYPSAVHTRFEHSLGVSHLARSMVQQLANRQPELNIDREEILCVTLAGLFHDLGHGPFSHTWERFMAAVQPDTHFEHEDISIRMMHHLIEDNNLMPTFKQFGLGSQHLEFIKELIVGPANGEDYTTRPAAKRFLFEIVANKRNGIDVDKFDYLRRDSRQVNVDGPQFDHSRWLEFARVLVTPDGTGQICYPAKDYINICDMFRSRFTMHSQVYQHRVTKAFEAMIIEAFVKADPYLEVPGKTVYSVARLKLINAWWRTDT